MEELLKLQELSAQKGMDNAELEDSFFCKDTDNCVK